MTTPGAGGWSHLSGGERARALLAAVLVAEPDVFLADEPGASLDIGHRIDLLERLAVYARTQTVTVVMHGIERAVRDCDRLLLLHRGRVVLDDTADAVARSPLLDGTFGVSFERMTASRESASLLVLSTRS